LFLLNIGVVYCNTRSVLSFWWNQNWNPSTIKRVRYGCLYKYFIFVWKHMRVAVS